jgi:hypothetical protein
LSLTTASATCRSWLILTGSGNPINHLAHKQRTAFRPFWDGNFGLFAPKNEEKKSGPLKGPLLGVSLKIA